jgi:hypothetical protein
MWDPFSRAKRNPMPSNVLSRPRQKTPVQNYLNRELYDVLLAKVAIVCSEKKTQVSSCSRGAEYRAGFGP